MAEPSVPEFPRGEMFLDARGNGRAMRLSWHPEADVVVLSLWRESTCAGTFRMPQADVGAFIDALIDGLRDAPGVHLPPPYPPARAQAAGGVAIDGAAGAAETGQSGPPAFTDWAFGPGESAAS